MMVTWKPTVSFWIIDRFVTVKLTDETIKDPSSWYIEAVAEYNKTRK